MLGLKWKGEGGRAPRACSSEQGRFKDQCGGTRNTYSERIKDLWGWRGIVINRGGGASSGIKHTRSFIVQDKRLMVGYIF